MGAKVHPDFAPTLQSDYFLKFTFLSVSGL